MPSDMYRKSSGRFGFKSLNIFGDLPGSLASSSGVDPGTISLPQQDSVYLYQLQSSSPCSLTGETLYVSKIIDEESVAQKVFQRLQKLNLITAEGEVDTAGFDSPTFGKQYTHTLSIIPVSRQKHLVEFLFWWDEETRRLKKLMAEKEELLSMGSGDTRVQQLLNRVGSKIDARPSARDQRVERDEDLVDMDHDRESGDAPPVYT